MKKLYSYGLSAALLLSGLSALAQNRPAGPAYALGSSQALVRQLETQLKTQPATQAQTGAARQQPPKVTLRVSATKTFTGRVNYREDLAATGEYLVGEIQGVPDASFRVRVEGPRVDGHIILRAARQAYRYAADAQGNVSVQEVDINQVLCIDYNKPTGYQEPTSAPAPGAASQSAAAVLSLQSLPGARGCVMLDLDGQYVAGTGWNNGNPIDAAPAVMVNDNAKVQALWELVSEDFRPFSINVTTDEAVFNSYPKNMRMRCIITPTNTAAPGAGGVAYVGSFNSTDNPPCWVFMSNDPKSAGEAASHEVGHTLGLGHDARPGEGYFAGHGSWAPIMGVGYYKPVSQWSRGEYANANNTQDDLAIMSGTRFNVGYRNDDHGNSTASATAVARSGSSVSGRGLIERTSDQDYFSFSTSGGTASLSVNTVSRYGNLDIVARLFDSSGNQIGTYDTPGGNKLDVSLSASLAAGTYYLQVDGTSSGNPATDGYSDYASLGTFSISGTVPASDNPPVSGVATVYRDCNYTGTATTLPPGDYPLSQLQARGVLNEDVSSLRVNSGYEVVLYENDNFSGAALTVGASGNSCLVGNPLGTGNWNDKTTSLRVRAAASAFSRQLEAEAFSVNNGMVVEATSDAGGGQNMGFIDQGDYLVFNGITFPTSGAYLIEYRVASGAGGGTISADLNAGSVQLGNTTIPGTGGWQTWRTVSGTVNINAGTYNFGVYAQTGGYNLNWIRITKTSSTALAALSTTAARTLASTALSPASGELEVYPNPVVDQLQFRSARSLAGSQFRVVDAVGRVVLTGSAAAGSVDVSGLKAGVYQLVVLTTDHAQVVRRFMK